MTTGAAGPRGSGRDLPDWWAPRPAPAEPSGAGRLRGAPRRGAGELRGGCGGRSGSLRVRRPGPAEPPRSPRGGLPKGRGHREAASGPEALTVPESVCAARKSARSSGDHVRHQQPRGGEEAAGEHAERPAGPVPGMQEKVPARQGGEPRRRRARARGPPGPVRAGLRPGPFPPPSPVPIREPAGCPASALYTFLWGGLRRFDFLSSPLLRLGMKFAEGADSAISPGCVVTLGSSGLAKPEWSDLGLLLLKAHVHRCGASPLLAFVVCITESEAAVLLAVCHAA